nr:BrnT family toxin [uncultured Sphaerochaeta sp.]
MYTWDPKKSEKNKKKNGFSFEDIVNVFDDPNLLDWVDWEHSTLEETRYQCIGRYENYLIIMIVYTDRNGVIRIISAREASPKEKKAYYEYEEKRR